MTKETEALKLALEALENGMKFVWTDPEREAGFVAIDAIKEALAQPPLPVQEPVGVVQCVSISGYPMQDSRGVEWLCAVPVGSKLYTSPPQEKT